MEERLFKIVWNDSGWKQPIKRKWSKVFNKDNKPAFEQQHGFVHEDWLFSSGFTIEGYQYGYIEGMYNIAKDISYIDKVHLFTIDLSSKKRMYVGILKNAKKIVRAKLNNEVLNKIDANYENMILQLKEVEADYKYFKNSEIAINIRFKIEDIELFDPPVEIVNQDFNAKYNRTDAYHIHEELNKILNGALAKRNFVFIPSTPFDKKKAYKKKGTTFDGIVFKKHQEIEEKLYTLLLNHLGAKNIACDNANIGGKLADIVVKNAKSDISYDIYEIKTNLDMRKSLREAIGQLIDYATWDPDMKINKIVAVILKYRTDDAFIQYVRRIQSRLNLSFEVLLYDNVSGSFEGLNTK